MAIEYLPDGTKVLKSGDTLTGTLNTQIVTPVTTGTYTLGDSSYYWSQVYGSRYYLNSTAYIDGATAGAINFTASTTSTSYTFSSASTGTSFQIKNSAGDAVMRLETTHAGNAANVNLIALGNYVGLTGTINGTRIWTMGNSGDATGLNIYTGSAGGTKAATFSTSGNLTVIGTITPQLAVTGSAPSYVKGAMYFDTTLNKLRIGGATAWETITSV